MLDFFKHPGHYDCGRNLANINLMSSFINKGRLSSGWQRQTLIVRWDFITSFYKPCLLKYIDSCLFLQLAARTSFLQYKWSLGLGRLVGQ